MGEEVNRTEHHVCVGITNKQTSKKDSVIESPCKNLVVHHLVSPLTEETTWTKTFTFNDEEG